MRVRGALAQGNDALLGQDAVHPFLRAFQQQGVPGGQLGIRPHVRDVLALPVDGEHKNVEPLAQLEFGQGQSGEFGIVGNHAFHDLHVALFQRFQSAAVVPAQVHAPGLPDLVDFSGIAQEEDAVALLQVDVLQFLLHGEALAAHFHDFGAQQFGLHEADGSGADVRGVRGDSDLEQEVALDAAGEHGGQGGAGREPFAAKGPEIEQPRRRVNEPHGRYREHLDAFIAQFLHLAQHDHVGGGAHHGAGAAQDGGVGEGNEEFGGRDVVVPAEGQHNGHQDDDHRGVVDEGGDHERPQRDDQQRGQLPAFGYLVEKLGEVPDQPRPFQGGAQDEHADHRQRAAVGKAGQHVPRAQYPREHEYGGSCQGRDFHGHPFLDEADEQE